MITRYSKFINEGFEIEDGRILKFVPGGEKWFDTSFGKFSSHKPYQMKVPGGKILSVYKQKKTKGRAEQQLAVEILKAIKGKSNTLKFKQDDYQKFISRTGLYLSKQITEHRIDTIITMNSGSNLASDLTSQILKRLPPYYNSNSFTDIIRKNPNFDDFYIDAEKYGLKQNTVDNLTRTLQTLKQAGEFKAHRFPAKFRRALHGWLIINNDNVLSNILNKRIAIIDDFLTTGSTMAEASNKLTDMGADFVLGLTAIKES